MLTTIAISITAGASIAGILLLVMILLTILAIYAFISLMSQKENKGGNIIPVKIVNKSGYPLPEYKNPASSGCDLRAKLDYPVKLNPLGRITIDTGIAVCPEPTYEAEIRPRSGMTKNNGIVAMLGTGDQDYTGNYGVTIINLSNEPFTIQPGDRIAQMVFVQVAQAAWIEVDELDKTARGPKGFGSTGMK